MYVGNLDALPALMSLPPKHWTLGRLSEDAKSEKLKGLGLTYEYSAGTIPCV